MKIFSFSLMMSLTLTLLTVGLVTTTQTQTAEAKENNCDRDDDPLTFCRAGGEGSGCKDDNVCGGGGNRQTVDLSTQDDEDIEIQQEGGRGGRILAQDPNDPTAVGGGGSQVELIEGTRHGGEGGHIQGEGDEGSIDN